MRTFGYGVVTVSNTAEVIFDAGFNFARRLTDAGFRKFLKDNGWRSGDNIVITVDEEPVVDVIYRVSLHETDGRVRAFIAIVDDREEYGCRLLIVEKASESGPPAERHVVRLDLGPGASVGMLYDALSPCGTYLPSEWSQELLFERAAT